MSKTYTCIVCPVSCEILVDDSGNELKVSGNQCKRGLAFATSEHTNPVRMLTTTIAIENSVLPRIPVISSAEIEKSKLNECLEELYEIKVLAPIKCGDIILKNICNTGTDIKAARSMKKI